jgi:Type I phosphodiesterase / nucleotide pyrophosphatase
MRKVLLIGWDAADWEHITPLLEEGLMPARDAFINRGVMGNLATLQPILSPILWNSVATGKLANKHGIHGFIEPVERVLTPANRANAKRFGIFSLNQACAVMSWAGGRVIRPSRSMAQW